MQENGRNGHRDRFTGGHDAFAQGAVLMTVFINLPDRPTVPDLSREIYSAQPFARADVVEKAVRDLTGKGLVRCRGGLVAPTRLARELWPVRW
ncbi:MAG TPA: hypothetical protein VEW07_11345 [Solirubrobacterales bacterium]|nr:hypothetical protein [Solirubrobacterales bacterium]